MIEHNQTTNNSSDDEFDPDLFDWGDDTTVEAEVTKVCEGLVQEAFDEALNVYNSTYVWHYAKEGDLRLSAKRIYQPKVILNVEQQRYLEAEFPNYTWDFSRSSIHHDHPVSHCATELNECEMVEDAVKKGNVYIDVFGNVGRAEKYKKKAHILYTKATAKDYIRYQHVDTKKASVFKLEDLWSDGRFKAVDDLFCTHAMYYLSLEDIASMCPSDTKRSFTALVHRHQFTHGYLNNGELEYWVDEKGMVTQKNVGTGESYHHPSVEALFHQFSAQTIYGGLTWTIRSAGADSYFIKFVGCPNYVADVFVPLLEMENGDVKQVEFNGLKIKKFLGWEWVSAVTATKEIQLMDLDLLNRLRLMAACKERTPRLKEDIANMAKRLTNKADIISIHGGGVHKVESYMLVHYVNAAFYMDVVNELEVAISYHKDNKDAVRMLNDFYAKGETPRDFSGIQRAVEKTIKVGGYIVKEAVAGFPSVDEYGKRIDRIAEAQIDKAIRSLTGYHRDREFMLAVEEKLGYT